MQLSEKERHPKAARFRKTVQRSVFSLQTNHSNRQRQELRALLEKGRKWRIPRS